MKTALTRFTVVICLLFGIQSGSMASSIEVSGTYTGFQTWDDDTILVIGDCIFVDILRIMPGSHVIFTDDYELSAPILLAEGLENDSIIFTGNQAGSSNKKGKLISNFVYRCPDTFGPMECVYTNVKYCMINNISQAILGKPSNTSFTNCNSVSVLAADSCEFIKNDTIELVFKLFNSILKQNKTFKTRAVSDNAKRISSFELDNCLFESNYSGIKIYGSWIWVSRSIFRNNNDTPLKIGSGSWPYVQIDNCCFINNKSDTGTGGIELNINKTVMQYPSTGTFVYNNTFYNNSGSTSNSLLITSSDRIKTFNNIFWNSKTNPNFEIRINSGYNEIFNCIIKDGLENIDIPEEFTIHPGIIITEYPEFVDSLDGKNLELVSGSPAINNGENTVDKGGEFGYITYDWDLKHDPRIFNSIIDIGAYEYIPKSYPEILYQSGDTNLFTGDTLRLKIQTNDHYDYSWFLNNALLAGEKDTCLVIDSVVVADAGEYKVRISNLTDTLWSAPMNIRVYPFTSAALLPDSLYLCPDSIEISLDIEGINFLWSTNDTTSSITVNETGTYWVQLTDSLGLNLTDTVVVYRPSSIEISGLYKGFDYEFCADTLLVVGNCEFRGITLKPGTFILFKGDYTIELYWLESYGTETDSITFCGSVIPGDTIKQGSLFDYSFNIWQEPPSFLSLTRLVNLKSVYVTRAEKCSFLQCHLVDLVYSNSNKLLRNDIVHFDYTVDSCRVVENKLLRFSFYYDRWNSQQYYFDCTNSTFLRNSSGLTTGGRGFLHIENCRFIENAGPVVNNPVYGIDKYPTPSVSIRYNKFYKNIGNILVFDFMGPEFSYVGITNNEFIENEGIAVSCNSYDYLTINNNLFVKNRTGSGPGSIYCYNGGNDKRVTIKNNTFVANRGETFSCMEIISDTACPINMIANNIFWDNSAAQSAYAVGINFVNSPSEVCELNLTHSVAIDTSKIAFISGAGFELAPKNSFNLSPEFADTLNDNYRLKSYSPYIDKGTGSAGDSDLDGNDRIYGKAIDIGAYEFIPDSIPELFSQSTDTLLCTGDSVLLSAETNDFCVYQWYVDGELIENANTNILSAKCPDDNSDMFQLRVSGLNDTLWTDTITISKAEPPATALSGDSVKVCRNENISISLDYVSLLPVSVQWYSQNSGDIPYTGDTVMFTEVIEDDKLFAIVKNTCGTDTSGIINLVVLELPEPDLGRDTAIRANERIILNAGPGYPHYLWNDNSIGQYLVAYAGDTIWCRVTNEAGCSGTDTIIIALNPLGLKPVDSDKLQVKIYPVPAEDVLTIELPEKMELPCTLSIYNLSGELIKKIESNSMITNIPVNDLTESGMYFLKIRTDSFNGTWKFLLE